MKRDAQIYLKLNNMIFSILYPKSYLSYAFIYI